jgi:hypothetical protein
VGRKSKTSGASECRHLFSSKETSTDINQTATCVLQDDKVVLMEIPSIVQCRRYFQGHQNQVIRDLDIGNKRGIRIETIRGNNIAELGTVIQQLDAGSQ